MIAPTMRPMTSCRPRVVEPVAEGYQDTSRILLGSAVRGRHLDVTDAQARVEPVACCRVWVEIDRLRVVRDVGGKVRGDGDSRVTEHVGNDEQLGSWVLQGSRPHSLRHVEVIFL